MPKDENKAEWQEEADKAATEAAKEFQVTWTAKELATWLAKWRIKATYKRLMAIVYGAYDLR